MRCSWKRPIAWLLAVAMTLSLSGTSAYAVDTGQVVGEMQTGVTQTLPLADTPRQEAVTLAQTPTQVDGVYQIGTAEQLRWFAGLVNGTLGGVTQNQGANAVLTADIDLSGETWTPIGTSSKKYSGTFDGNGYTIFNLTIGNASSNSGLFGCVTGTVQNLTVTGSITVSESSVLYVGGVVAYADNNAHLTGLTSRVNITVTGADALRIGGIVGGTYNNVGITIETCVFEGSIKVQNGGTASQLGGIIGYAWVCTVKNCANLGTVSGGNQDIGGIIGYCNNNEITIRNCFNGVVVTGESNVGAIIGRDPSHQAVITWCFYIDGNDGDVGNGDQNRAEKVTEGQIISGYVTYMLNEKKSTEDCLWRQNIGLDLVPVLDSTHWVVYLDGENYVNKSDSTHTHSYDDWNGFCLLCGRYQPATKSGDYYQISNAGQLFWFAALVNGEKAHADFAKQDTTANARLTVNITIPDGMTWTSIGTQSSQYNGTFDGDGYVIHDLVNSSAGSNTYSGFVSYLGPQGKIQSVILGNTCSFADANTTGGICSWNYGTITGCTNRGNVNGKAAFVGGICGFNAGIIEGCKNEGKITGNTSTGGICGYSSGRSILDCINSGSVAGTEGAGGGICGSISDGGTITDCENRGGVSGAFSSGGICGELVDGTITGCENTSTVNGSRNVGGICGLAYIGYIIDCWNSSMLYPEAAWLGGICGYNTSGTIENCTAERYVYSTKNNSYVGGICGLSQGTIRNCATLDTATSSGALCQGGICGVNEGIIENCMHSGNPPSASSSSQRGSICGKNTSTGSIRNCYWKDYTYYYCVAIAFNDGTTENVLVKNATEFASGEVCYLLNGSTSSGEHVWRQNLNIGEPDKTPVLDTTHGLVYTTRSCGGTVTGYSNTEGVISGHSFDDSGMCACGMYEPAEQNDSGVYEITNAGQLFWFAALVNGDTTCAEFETQDKGANAVLTADVDLAGRNWTSIGNGTVTYVGIFDGQGHTISGLTLENAPSYSGLFGNSEGVVRNFTLTGSITVATDNIRSVAGVAGYMKNASDAGGTISNVLCDVDIVVTAANTQHIGGIVGSLGQSSSGTALVEVCTYAGTMTSDMEIDCLGGVAAYAQNATIHNCCNLGTITGQAGRGGVLGYCNDSRVTVASCYNYGSVADSKGMVNNGAIIGINRKIGSLTNCYWLSGSAASGIGTGSGPVEEKGGEAFASGEVAYLLNGSTSEGDLAWYQNLDNGQMVDEVPVLDSRHGTVYRIEGEPVSYSNDPNSQPPVIISVDITWGDLNFTYSDGTWNANTHTYDGVGWTVDDEASNAITVANNGTLPVTVSYACQAVENGISGSFADGEDKTVSGPVALPAWDSTTVWLLLEGKPELALDQTTIGGVTVTIGGE